jgi:hypothetical protein
MSKRKQDRTAKQKPQTRDASDPSMSRSEKHVPVAPVTDTPWVGQPKVEKKVEIQGKKQ